MSEFIEGFKIGVQLLAFLGGFFSAVLLAWIAVGLVGDAFRSRLIP